MAKAKKAAPKKAVVKTPVAKAPAKKVIVAKKVVAEPTKVAQKNAPNAIFNIDEINNLINAVNHSNVNELKLEKGDFKITIRQGGAVVMTTSAPQQQVVHTAPAVASAPVAPSITPVIPAQNSVEINPETTVVIKSPMIGTFYRSAGPSKPLFVNVGDDIKVGQVLCIVEAMKLFNEIESEISGKIVKVLVDDASPIEYDQPLFLVQP